MPCSVIAGDEGEAMMRKHRSQFADSVKDLKNLRKQLYSAAEYFESSYNRDNNHKQFVVESSKEYVAKALVNTVDHLGSVADKLNKFMDQNANQLSTTTTHFSSIQQRLCMVKGLVQSRSLQSHHLFHTKDTCNLKHTILKEAENPNVLHGNRFSYLPVPDDLDQPKQESSFSKSFEAARKNPDARLMRKQVSRMQSREASPNRQSFSFTKMAPSKEAGSGKRSVSPLAGLRFNLSGKRSVSPNPSLNKGQRETLTEGRRAVSASRGRERRNTNGNGNGNRETEMESYTKKSKHLLKALLSLHHSRKLINSNSTQTNTGIAYYNNH